jgi:LPS-assembly protein
MNAKSISLIFVFFFSFLLNVLPANGQESIYELQGKSISYEDDQNLIVATGDAYAKDQLGKEIYSDKIIYDKKKFTVTTSNKSIYLDGKGNKLEANEFFYDLKLKKIKANSNVNYFSKEGDHFKFSFFEYYESLQKGSGENFVGKMADGSLLEGATAKIDGNKGTVIVSQDKAKLKRNAYTPCINKKGLEASIKEKCPDWSVTSSKTTHDKNKKMLYHKNVFVNIRNVPVFYTPYFSHPDPSVKRKSGFLPPSIKNYTNLGRSFKAPYFVEISRNKDFTFTPIYYVEENPLFLGEYRQKNKNSEYYVDTSYSQGYKKLNKKDDDGTKIQRTDGSRNHFFFKFLGSYDDLIFSSNDLEMNVQKVSQKNYLKVHQINTNNIKQDISALQNDIILRSYENSKQLTLEGYIYENLNEENHSKKYQYTLPTVTFNNFLRKFNQAISFNNSVSAKNLGENINQTHQINQINTTSELKKINTVQGLGTVFKTSINNFNTYNENVEGAKENMNNDIYGTLAIENSYPLIKYNDKTEQSISPILFSKYTTGSMEDASSQSKTLNYQDIFSMDRTSNLTTIETGASVGYGFEYNINKKDSNNNVYLDAGFSIGQIAKQKKLKQMPKNSSLQEKKSDYMGNSSFKIKSEKFNNSAFNIDYNYIVNNNFNALMKNELTTSFTNSHNQLGLVFYEENKIGGKHYVEANYKKKFNNSLNFSMGTRKNLQEDFTERNFIETNYESDCLKIGLNLSKVFYQDGEIKPSNNLTFSIVLKPFGSPVAPDLSNFLN